MYQYSCADVNMTMNVLFTQAAIIGMGFVNVARSETATCTVMLSKLPFAQQPESIDLDAAHQWSDQIKTCVGKLTRDESTGQVR